MRIIACTFLTLLIFTSCNDKPKEESLVLGQLTILQSKPTPGDRIEFNYSTTDSLNTKPEVLVYYLTNTDSYPQDVSLDKEGTTYKGQLQISDSTTAVVINFKNGSEYDTNDNKGYLFPLYNKEGQVLPGGTMSEAWFKLSRGSQFGYEIAQDSAFAIMNKTYENHPDLQENWTNTLINLANQVDKDRAESLMKNTVASLKEKENLSEIEYTSLERIYSLQKNEKATDSIRKLAIADYPKGTFAKQTYVDRMGKASDLAEMKAVLEDYNKDINLEGAIKDYLLGNVANGYLTAEDYKNYENYIVKQQNKLTRASNFNNAAWSNAQQNENMDLASRLSKRSLQLVDETKADTTSKPEYYSQKQFEEQLASSKMMYADTYAYILHKQGNIKEALSYQETALGKGENPEVNERYIQFLIDDKQFKKAQKNAEAFVENNNATAKTKEYLETAYVENNTNTKDFDTYLAALEKTGRQKAMTALKENMIDEEAPQFKLTNLDGKQVALTDLKGKTVVLDFWATWCGPCKNSFPGMQMAVDKFKDDPNVEFLFVDTWESSAGKERAQSVTDFISENKYTFNVLMDTPVEEGSSSYNVVSDYKVDGIPTKFVLGPDGRIKFKAVGFDGNTEGLAKEIDMMISLAQS